MKRRVLSLLLAFSMMLQLMSGVAMAAEYPVPEIGAQDALAKFAKNREWNPETDPEGETLIPMSVSHRAAWRNGPECSLIAIAASIEMGVDVVELDVKLTEDGILVLSHDETVNRCTPSTGNVSSYTWEELKAIPLESGQGSNNVPYTLTEEDAALLNSLPHYAEHSGEAVAGGTMPMTRLDDAIDLIKALGPNTMINWDHCFSQERFVASYILFRETGMLGNVFIKNSNDVNTQNAWYDAAAAAWNEKHPDDTITAEQVQDSILYVYIIRSADYSPLQAHLENGDNLVMTEICIADDATDEAIEARLEPWCKANGVAMFINTMWSGLCSTKADTETTWAEMLNRGYVAIQTDRASELAEYMDAYNSSRNAVSVIEAEHFHNFNYDEYGLYVAAGADASLNKKVEGMESGDWMEYRNIVFDGSEVMLNLNMKGQAGGVLSVYLDGMAEENRIAKLTLSPASAYSLVTAELESAIAAGSHTVYLQVSGAVNMDLVSIDDFRFISSRAFEGEVTVAEVAVTTQVGIAPVLPGTVEVTVNAGTEAETSYGLEVRWEQVTAEAYAAAGELRVLGYVPVLGRYIQAKVSVVGNAEVEPGITTEGLALWLDASEGITAADNAVTEWQSKVGDITATLRTGSPTLVADVPGGNAGVYFDGDDALDITLPEGFWSGKSEYTILTYAMSEIEENGGSGTPSQYYSIMYFGETGDWGSAYFTVNSKEVVWRFGSGNSGDYGTTVNRPVPIGDLYSSTVIRKDGFDETVFVNDEKIYSGTAAAGATANTSNVGYIGVGKNSRYFEGTICQILIYDRALTDEEIMAAQLTMAQKYEDKIASVETVSVTSEVGEEPVMPDRVTVTYESGRTSSVGVIWEKINPTYYISEGSFTVNGTLGTGETITANVTVVPAAPKEEFPIATRGLMFWLSAGNGVTTDDNGNVTQWQSRVGDYYATSRKGDTSLVEDAVNSQPAVNFDGDEDVLEMVLGDGALNGLDGVTVVVYAKPETAWKYDSSQSFNWNVQRRTLFYVDESAGWGSFYTGVYTDAVSARFGTGTSGDNGFRQERTETVNEYSTTVIRWDGSAKTYDVDVNGADFGTESSVGSVTGNNKSTVYLGTGKGNTYWTGNVCEILVYDCVLTDAELKTVYDYLEDMYEPKDKTVTTEDLLLWMDASQGVTVDAGGNVTEWASQTDNGYKATVRTGDTSYSDIAVNGHPGVVFDGDGDMLEMVLADGALNGLSEVTVIVYGASQTNWQYSGPDFAWNVQRRTLLYAGESGSWGSFYAGIYADAISARFGTGTANDNGFRQQRTEPMSDYATTVIRWDGATKTYDVDVDEADFETGSSKAGTTANNNSTLYLGGGKEDTCWTGTVGDILVYTRALSDSQLESIYNYLEDKYAPVAGTSLPVPVTGIYLKEEGQQLTLHRGDTFTLTASAVPADADNTALTYTSSNTDVATVDGDGKITAVGWGYTTIIATTEDGDYQAVCSVFVDRTESEKIWQNIQDILSWADGQDPADYDNWDETMGKAISEFDASGLTVQSEAAELKEAYSDLRAALVALLEPVAYAYTENSKNQAVGVGQALTVEILPDSQYLLSVSVNGNSLDAKDYTVTSAYINTNIKYSGGMLITLTEAYMSTLVPNTYTLTVRFVNGVEDVETTFTIGCSHDSVSVVGKTNATCTSDGYSGDQVCKVCQAVVKRGTTEAQIGHTYYNGFCIRCGVASPGTRVAGAPTGDTADLALWTTLICLTGGAAVCLVYFKKRDGRA